MVKKKNSDNTAVTCIIFAMSDGSIQTVDKNNLKKHLELRKKERRDRNWEQIKRKINKR